MIGSRMTFANMPPTLSLVLTSDLVIYLIVRATGPETHGAGHRRTGRAGRHAATRASRTGWR